MLPISPILEICCSIWCACSIWRRTPSCIPDVMPYKQVINSSWEMDWSWFLSHCPKNPCTKSCISSNGVCGGDGAGIDMHSKAQWFGSAAVGIKLHASGQAVFGIGFLFASGWCGHGGFCDCIGCPWFWFTGGAFGLHYHSQWAGLVVVAGSYLHQTWQCYEIAGGFASVPVGACGHGVVPVAGAWLILIALLAPRRAARTVNCILFLLFLFC